MESLSRVAAASVDVLRSLMGAVESTWGLRIVKDSPRPPGPVSPILDRLERSGWVGSVWEDDTGRSGLRRRLYEFTADGALAARSTVAEFDARSRSVRTAEIRTAEIRTAAAHA